MYSGGTAIPQNRNHQTPSATYTIQKMAERHEAEMEALVSEEKVVADLLEARAAEVKQVCVGIVWMCLYMRFVPFLWA